MYILKKNKDMFRITGLILVCFSIIAFGEAMAQDTLPQNVRPITKSIYPPAYYQQQTDLWEKETDARPEDPVAWFNYYKAARYANMLGGTQYRDLDALIEKMGAHIPGTFEYHYSKYWQNPISASRYKDLFRAYEIDPSRKESCDGLINYFERHRNLEKVKEHCRRWLDSGDYSPHLLYWNYNALMSVEPNSILITQGDNDTYPIMLLQHVKGIQPGVKMANIHLLVGWEDYRSKIFREWGIPELQIDPEMSPIEQHVTLASHLFEHASEPVYLGIAISSGLRDWFKDSLYLTGLAFKYSPDPFENVIRLRKNFEFRFLTDHLLYDFFPDESTSVARQMNLNYLPTLLTLYKDYTKQGEAAKAARVKTLAVHLAKLGNREDAINNYFAPRALYEASSWKFPEWNIRKFEKQFSEVDGSIWAGQTEVTNKAYQEFLLNLLRNRASDLLEQCKLFPTNWRSLLPPSVQGITDDILFENGHPEDPEMPIQNISFDNALEYCMWLTARYNHPSNDKRTYKKVVFRLPGHEEWERAARSGRSKAPYPWGGYYARNAQGCYLLNCDPSQDSLSCLNCPGGEIGKDGGYFPLKADQYFPNGIGLYNTSGNVAEMVNEPGLARGGSWMDAPENCKINSVKRYEGRSPAVGFRLFMEVLEE